MTIRRYQDLLVWQKSMDLALVAYRICRGFPTEERFGLSSQLSRAAVSVPSNLAEGHARISRGDFRRHVSIARGSLAEFETVLLLAERLGYLDRIATEEARGLAESVGRMLTRLLLRLRTSS